MLKRSKLEIIESSQSVERRIGINGRPLDHPTTSQPSTDAQRQRKDMSLIGLKAAAGREWLELAADQWRAALMKSACSADAVLAETPGLFTERSVRAQWIVKELWALHVANQVAKGSAPVALLNQPLLDIFEAVTASARRVALGPDELIQQLSSELLAGV